MTVYEILTIALIAVLALATLAAIWVGLLGWMGQFYIVRCSECSHVMFSSAKNPQRSCARCRHPLLMHPVRAVVHPTRLDTVNTS